MLNLRLLVPPVTEPVSLAAMKAFLVVDDGFCNDDSVISSLISAARLYCENAMNRAIYNQTWSLALDYFPSYYPVGTTSGLTPYEYLLGLQVLRQQCIHLPKPNLVSVTSIAYTDVNGDPQTVDSSTYVVDTSSEPGRLAPMPETTWPIAMFYSPGSILITYVAGSFGDGLVVDNCPQSIKIAIQLLVAAWYSSRSGTSPVNMTSLPFGVDVLLGQYKLMGMGF